MRKRPGKRPAAARGRDAGEYSSPAAARGRDAGEYSSAAVPATYEAPDLQGVPRKKEVEEPQWARIPLDGDGPPGLPWADHVVHTLVSNGHLPSSALNQIELQVWSDCSGINSEKFAWNELRDAIRHIIGADVVLALYYTCDSDPKSIAFAQANHQPQHVGSNISQRNFTSGECWCTLRKGNFPIPRVGVDLYVGTYPCSPWSRRGPRTGWEHPSVEPFRIGVQTLSYIQPAVWIIEFGELPENASSDEVISAIQEVLDQDGREYIIQLVRTMGPAIQGYPIRRPRTYVIGWRKDACPDAAVVARPLQTLIRNPLDVSSSYRGFLKISHPYDWSGVGCFYVGASLEYISGIACRCACNPYVACPVHPCKCDRCARKTRARERARARGTRRS